jgi:phytanoyl-CoA hydroxylase
MNALTTTLTHVPRFTLGPEITPEQRAFLDRWGFLIFAGVASPAEIQALAAALDEVQARWIAEGRKWVYGIPLTVGKDSAGGPFVQRFAFTSMFSETVRSFVRDQRFEPVRRLIGEDARIGDDEKDGVVVNRYLNNPGSEYPRLGWHTDGLRDLFYLRMPQQMLNVGLHFDEISADNGGLRLIPGSHNQGFFDMCFRKLYFLQHAARPSGDRRRDQARGSHRARWAPVAPGGGLHAGGAHEPATLDVCALPQRAL